MAACHVGLLLAVRILLKTIRGGDDDAETLFTQCNIAGETALHSAAQRGHDGIVASYLVQMMRERHLPFGTVDVMGRTPWRAGLGSPVAKKSRNYQAQILQELFSASDVSIVGMPAMDSTIGSGVSYYIDPRNQGEEPTNGAGAKEESPSITPTVVDPADNTTMVKYIALSSHSKDGQYEQQPFKRSMEEPTVFESAWSSYDAKNLSSFYPSDENRERSSSFPAGAADNDDYFEGYANTHEVISCAL